jgi:hypothetical protein
VKGSKSLARENRPRHPRETARRPARSDRGGGGRPPSLPSTRRLPSPEGPREGPAEKQRDPVWTPE